MITITLLIIIICLICRKIMINKALNNLYFKLVELAEEENVKKIEKNKAFDFEMKYNNKTFLIKMVYHPSRDEININSKDFWQVNHGVVSSRKTGEQMKNVYDLINYNLSEYGYDKSTVKLYVIYPYSNRLLKVLNECEMKFITPKIDIYGCRINNYSDLTENIDEF